MVSFVSNVLIAGADRLPRRPARRRRPALHRRHRGPRHPDLLQRRRDPSAHLPRLSPMPTQPTPPGRPRDPDADDRAATPPCRTRPLPGGRDGLPRTPGPAARSRGRAAGRARLRRGRPGAGQRAGRRLRRRPAGRPDPAHQHARAGHRPCGGRDRRAAADPRLPARRHRVEPDRGRAARGSRPRPSASWPAPCRRSGPGVRVTVDRRGRRRRHRPAAQRPPGAARRRRRGDRDQRPGPGRRPDVAPGRATAGCRRRHAARGAVRHRRDRRPAHAGDRARLRRRLHRRGRERRRRRRRSSRASRRGRDLAPCWSRATPTFAEPGSSRSSLPIRPARHDRTDPRRGAPCTPRT